MKKILVVDDNDAVRMFIKETLEMKGLEVIEADDGDIALEMVGSDPDIELLILDLKMPRMSGKEAYRLIRPMRPDLKCIVSSSEISDEDMKEFSTMGVKTFLRKPYGHQDLYKAVSDLADETREPGSCSSGSEGADGERRQAERKQFERTVYFFVYPVEFAGLRRLTLKAVTTDLSGMGVGITTDYPLKPGCFLRFSDKVEDVGIVKWIMKRESSYRAGVHFLTGETSRQLNMTCNV